MFLLLRWSSRSLSTVAKSSGVLSPSTPLLSELHERIFMRGPISISEYMTVCLTHPLHGYYATRDALGKTGDFITSPEISQTFGEMIGIWVVDTWEKLGKPEKMNLVELGGGHGTLMADVLRTVSLFPAASLSLRNVAMIDSSEKMKQRQREKVAPYLNKFSFSWYSRFSDVAAALPKQPTLILCQEFFDALPVHQFKHTNRGWCEQLVDIVPEVPAKPQQEEEEDKVGGVVDLSGERHHLRFVLSLQPTPASKMLMSKEMLLATGRHSEIEIGTMAGAIVQEIALFLQENLGACLIIDYGSDGPSGDSLRGIKDHKFCHPLKEPGLVDLSVDVDFSYLKKAVSQGLERSASVNNSDRPLVVKCKGPITQEMFLKNMGIEYRVASMIRKLVFPEEKMKLFQEFNRLTKEMGTCYKVLELCTHNEESSGFVALKKQ